MGFGSPRRRLQAGAARGGEAGHPGAWRCLQQLSRNSLRSRETQCCSSEIVPPRTWCVGRFGQAWDDVR